MIIVSAPLRIGLAGGGSDLPSYFLEHPPGVCINAAINKYVYVLVRRRHDDLIYLKYSKNEIVKANELDSIEHDFIRETLKYLDPRCGLEIINFADIPTAGTGLGSSSSFLVCLLYGLHQLFGQYISREDLHREACLIEVDLCKKRMGYQDQAAAVYGGLKAHEFRRAESDMHTPSNTSEFSHCVADLSLSEHDLRDISSRLMMIYTGVSREAKTVLNKQDDNLKNDQHVVDAMKANVSLAMQLSNDLKNKRFFEIGHILRANWDLKKKFADNISDPNIDQKIDFALHHGAVGCKITGAGGGGFIVMYVEPAVRASLKAAFTREFVETKEMPFEIDPYGAKVMINVENFRW